MPNTDPGQNSDGSPALSSVSGSVEQPSYQRGYYAGQRREREKIQQLENQIAAIRAFQPWSHEKTVEYLLTTADVLTRAAKALLDMRQEKSADEPSAPPNARSETPERKP